MDYKQYREVIYNAYKHLELCEGPTSNIYIALNEFQGLLNKLTALPDGTPLEPITPGGDFDPFKGAHI